nr:MAG TPA: hypothetical protein [Caudoviricetes sp.]DAL14373.1 MAG TPA_asm: hypothetical protein [Caudoviricetes sp.]
MRNTHSDMNVRCKYGRLLQDSTAMCCLFFCLFLEFLIKRGGDGGKGKV